uniref:Uncharacterized protein n=1 Tax=Timema cristinae TaxID=61476 RepID=A0A7R9CXQ6_TIMCR|nr:unnamed protein product [Timema cristinae]
MTASYNPSWLSAFNYTKVEGGMARLKLDRRTSDTERSNQVTQLIVSLGLQDKEDTMIGSQGSNKVLSGGEKKRLSFATEMLTDPPLLFCDEPTTGLDSYSAQKLVCMMKLMASKGKTVLCTIHQPSSNIFNMFNQFILVAEGRIAYFGFKETALTFFEGLGYICPPMNNPADFFIRTLSVTPGSEHESRMAINKICNKFAASEAAMEVDMIVRNEQHMGSSFEVIQPLPNGLLTAPGIDNTPFYTRLGPQNMDQKSNSAILEIHTQADLLFSSARKNPGSSTDNSSISENIMFTEQKPLFRSRHVNWEIWKWTPIRKRFPCDKAWGRYLRQGAGLVKVDQWHVSVPITFRNAVYSTDYSQFRLSPHF